jgi:hypothetical protein
MCLQQLKGSNVDQRVRDFRAAPITPHKTRQGRGWSTFGPSQFRDAVNDAIGIEPEPIPTLMPADLPVLIS